MTGQWKFDDDNTFDHTNVTHISVDAYFVVGGAAAAFAACAMSYGGNTFSCNSSNQLGPETTSGWFNTDLCSSSCSTWSNTSWYAWVGFACVSGYTSVPNIQGFIALD